MAALSFVSALEVWQHCAGPVQDACIMRFGSFIVTAILQIVPTKCNRRCKLLVEFWEWKTKHYTKKIALHVTNYSLHRLTVYILVGLDYIGRLHQGTTLRIYIT